MDYRDEVDEIIEKSNKVESCANFLWIWSIVLTIIVAVILLILLFMANPKSAWLLLFAFVLAGVISSIISAWVLATMVKGYAGIIKAQALKVDLYWKQVSLLNNRFKKIENRPEASEI